MGCMGLIAPAIPANGRRKQRERRTPDQAGTRMTRDQSTRINADQRQDCLKSILVPIRVIRGVSSASSLFPSLPHNFPLRSRSRLAKNTLCHFPAVLRYANRSAHILRLQFPSPDQPASVTAMCRGIAIQVRPQDRVLDTLGSPHRNARRRLRHHDSGENAAVGCAHMIRQVPRINLAVGIKHRHEQILAGFAAERQASSGQHRGRRRQVCGTRNTAWRTRLCRPSHHP